MNKKFLLLSIIVAFIGLHTASMNYVRKSMVKELPPLFTGTSFLKHVITSPKTYGFLTNWTTTFFPLILGKKIEKNLENEHKSIYKPNLSEVAVERLQDVGIDPNIIYTSDNHLLLYNQNPAFALTSREYGEQIVFSPEFIDILNNGNDDKINEVLAIGLHENAHLRNNDLKKLKIIKPALYLSSVLVTNKIFKTISFAKNLLIPNRLSSPGKIKRILLYPWEITKGVLSGFTKMFTSAQVSLAYNRKIEQEADDCIYHSNPQKMDFLLKGGEEFSSNMKQKVLPVKPTTHPTWETRIAKFQARRQKLREDHPDLFQEEDLRIKN